MLHRKARKFTSECFPLSFLNSSKTYFRVMQDYSKNKIGQRSQLGRLWTQHQRVENPYLKGCKLELWSRDVEIREIPKIRTDFFRSDHIHWIMKIIWYAICTYTWIESVVFSSLRGEQSIAINSLDIGNSGFFVLVFVCCQSLRRKHQFPFEFKLDALCTRLRGCHFTALSFYSEIEFTKLAFYGFPRLFCPGHFGAWKRK